MTQAVSGRVCDRCGRSLPPDALRRASVPSENAVAALSMSDPDDVPPIDHAQLVDHKWYCPSCRRSVNLRRVLFILLVCVVTPALAYSLLQLLL